jgi:hypothetical protein
LVIAGFGSSGHPITPAYAEGRFRSQRSCSRWCRSCSAIRDETATYLAEEVRDPSRNVPQVWASARSRWSFCICHQCAQPRAVPDGLFGSSSVYLDAVAIVIGSAV